jgi:hypothetical protein
MNSHCSRQDETFVTLGLVRNNRANGPFFPQVYRWRIDIMTRFKALGAIGLAVALAAASPAMARGIGGGGRGAAVHAGGGAHFAAGGAHFAGGGTHFGGGGFRGHRGGGFGPGIAAGIVAGSVLGGAYGYYGAPAYYGDSYAYDDGGYGSGYYNDPNGFVCQPGTWFRGADGRRHLCQ